MVQKNSIKMVKMYPEMYRIKAKYFGNKDKISEEQYNLYRRENYHPMLRYQLHRWGYTAENLCRHHMRGGCNPWDVSWIIALVLDAALGFEEEARQNAAARD